MSVVAVCTFAYTAECVQQHDLHHLRKMPQHSTQTRAWPESVDG
jgi:hypothetical protein